ncbi:MAG: RHS repeat-associated core domain-containing protein [Nitrospira sp.]
MATVAEKEPIFVERRGDATDRVTTITDARGITYLTNTYCGGTATCPLDPAVATQTLADGSATSFDYLSVNQAVMQTTVTDPRGKQTVHRFNSRGHEIAAVDAVSQQTRLTRDYVTNQVSEVRDPLNRLTKYTYDLAGNVNSILDPQGNPTIFEYESTFNRATRITDALNQQTRFTYDPANGNLLTSLDPLNHATAISYNQFGQPVSVTDALGNVTQFEYDEVGNLSATIDPLGNRTLRFYDAVSRLVAMVDARGKSTQFTYDSVNQVTQLTDALNGTTTFTYDPNGNLLTLSDAKNQVTTYTYDNMDRLVTRTDALNRTESYLYDLAGNLTRFTDRKNQITNFQYDPLNRRTLTSYADSTSVAVAYDAVGNVTKLTDSASGVIDWAYDVLDRVTQEVTPQGIVSYSYDVLSRRQSMRANAQAPVTYSYDANSQLTQVAQGPLSGILTHDALGRRTQLQRSNGVATTYNYDPASRLLGITHAKGATVLEQLAQGFDQADNKTQVNQLIHTATALPPAVIAAYDAVNAQTQFNSTTSQTLGYDPNGNLATTTEPAGATTYAWDSRDRLTGLTSPSLTASFQYDALDRRISKTINGVTSTYQYDGADLLTETGPTQATYLSSLNIDEPLVRQTSAGNEFYLANDLGSTLALTDDTGAVTTSYTYGPFGTTTVTGTSTNPVQFTGRENDGTGLYYYRARYYSPSHGRFLAEDPLEFGAGDANLYGYVGNNPTNFTDPTGEKIKLPPGLNKCIVGMIKAIAKIAGINLTLRKPDVDPTDLLDAAKGCIGGGGSAGSKASNGSTPAGRPHTKHYDQETGPKRNIPGSVVDNTIDNYPGVPAGGGKTAHYDPNNNVTVVTGDGGSIVSAHKGPPRSGQVKK